MAKKSEITVKDVTIKTIAVNDIDYICITDIARQKNEADPNGVIANWMRNRNTVEFLGIWETLNNPNFNPLEFEGFRKEAGLNAFTLSPSRWIAATNAIGILSQSGRYGGTYAVSDIAFELWKVAKYSNGTVLFDKVNDTDTTASIKQVTNKDSKKQKVNKEIKKYTEEDTLDGKSDDIKSLYYEFKEFVLSNYDDLEITHWKYYFVFKANNKIVASASVLANSIKTWINLTEVDEIKDPKFKVRDVHNVGHHGVGNFEYVIKSEDDFYYFDSLFKQAYEEKV